MESATAGNTTFALPMLPADAAAAAAEAARAAEEAARQAAKDAALLNRQQELVELSTRLLADGRALKQALGSEPFQRVFAGFRARGCVSVK